MHCVTNPGGEHTSDNTNVLLWSGTPEICVMLITKVTQYIYFKKLKSKSNFLKKNKKRMCSSMHFGRIYSKCPIGTAGSVTQPPKAPAALVFKPSFHGTNEEVELCSVSLRKSHKTEEQFSQVCPAGRTQICSPITWEGEGRRIKWFLSILYSGHLMCMLIFKPNHHPVGWELFSLYIRGNWGWEG